MDTTLPFLQVKITILWRCLVGKAGMLSTGNMYNLCTQMWLTACSAT